MNEKAFCIVFVGVFTLLIQLQVREAKADSWVNLGLMYTTVINTNQGNETDIENKNNSFYLMAGAKQPR